MNTVMMRRGEWRAINALYGRMLLNRPLIAATVVHEDDLEPGWLVWLESLGFVAGEDPETENPISLERAFRQPRPTNPGGVNLDASQVTVGLTPAGVAWWHTDPYQCALHAAHRLAMEPVWKIITRRRVDPDLIAAIVAAGLAAIVDMAAARADVPASDVTTAALRNAPRTWHLTTTTAGRRALAI